MRLGTTIVRMLPKRVKRFLTARIRSLVKREIATEQSKTSQYVTSIDFGRTVLASIERVNYVDQQMGGSQPCSDKWSVLDLAIRKADAGGAYLEFGVFNGESINFIASRVPKTIVHGFDSFQGLPEDWMTHVTLGPITKGMMDMQGRLPRVRSNVELHRGWFEDVLPTFAERDRSTVSFLHIDCDIYSSTKTVFTVLGDRIDSGCVIVFDEYLGYPGWQNHEYKAFQEFVREKGLSYRYLCYNEGEFQVAVVIM